MAKLTRKEKVASELLIIENSLLYWKTVIILNIFRPLSVEKKNSNEKQLILQLVRYTTPNSTVYILEQYVSSQCLLSTLLNQLKLVYGLFGQSAQYILFLPQISQDKFNCTTVKEQLRAYCPNIPIYCDTRHMLS